MYLNACIFHTIRLSLWINIIEVLLCKNTIQSEKKHEYHLMVEAQKKQIDDLNRYFNEQRNSIDRLQRNLSEDKKATENALNR